MARRAPWTIAALAALPCLGAAGEIDIAGIIESLGLAALMAERCADDVGIGPQFARSAAAVAALERIADPGYDVATAIELARNEVAAANRRDDPSFCAMARRVADPDGLISPR